MSSGIQTDVWSDLDMHCPAEWYGGYKEGRLLQAGDAERALSDWFTGDWSGSTFRFQLSDYDMRLRKQLAGTTDRYWNQPIAARMTTRANRAVLGTPYTIFVGPMIDAQPLNPLQWEITVGDAISAGILSDRLQLPFRQIKDGFLDQLDAVSERLDPETPEPILYGEHRRIPLVSADSEQGFRPVPTYLGIMGGRHVWMVAGHACKQLGNIFLDGVAHGEGTNFLIATHPNHLSTFGTPYNDFLSSTYGVMRRYTLIFGVEGDPEADSVALGEVELTVDVNGIEDIGDGSGELIRKRFLQYKHFLINFVAHQGQDSYQSGEWLSTPQWSLMDAEVDVVEESSFDDADAISVERYPGLSPYFGYTGAAAIGVRSGDRAGVRDWIAKWNRSCGCRFGINHFGQMRIVLLHPTETAKAAARLYTDNYEILAGSFGTSVRWDMQATSIPFRTDYEHATGVWRTTNTAVNSEAIALYGRDIQSEIREYPFAPGIAESNHLAVLESRLRAHPLRFIRMEGIVGPDPASGDSLGYLDLGDYFKYLHYDAVTAQREERLAQVVRHTVRASARRVAIEAIDCEAYIGYDVEGSPGGSWGGSP
jgi:hypothetical protein